MLCGVPTRHQRWRGATGTTGMCHCSVADAAAGLDGRCSGKSKDKHWFTHSSRKHRYLRHLISTGSPLIHLVYLAKGYKGCQPPLTGDQPGGLCSLLSPVGGEQAQLLEGILFCKIVSFETWKTPVTRRSSAGLIIRRHCPSHLNRLFV